MTHFLGTHQNRLDAKGRVSVPAPFRAALRNGGDANGNSATTGMASAQLVLRPSHQYRCIEAWPVAVFHALAAPLDRLDLFSEDHDDLASTLYAEAFPAETEKEGRIVLPDIADCARRTARGRGVRGLGRTFQIWEPEAASAAWAEARERTCARRLTLPGVVAHRERDMSR